MPFPSVGEIWRRSLISSSFFLHFCYVLQYYISVVFQHGSGWESGTAVICNVPIRLCKNSYFCTNINYHNHHVHLTQHINYYLIRIMMSYDSFGRFNASLESASNLQCSYRTQQITASIKPNPSCISISCQWCSWFNLAILLPGDETSLYMAAVIMCTAFLDAK
jgi:hypothetical protein